MPQPTAYNQINDYSDELATTAVPASLGTHLDEEFNAVEQTLDSTLANLALIQRDDGGVRNGVVTPDSLSAATLLLMSSSAWVVKGAWATLTVYAVGDLVTQGGSTYVCATAHTAGTFATDLAAAKWIALTSTNNADTMPFTPAGNIAAATVQLAIEELQADTEAATAALDSAKLNKSGGTMTGALIGTDGNTLKDFPAGTRMLFQQTTAPTGWTKEVSATYNDAAMRVVTGTAGTGGADAFTSHFGTPRVTGNHTLTTSEIPAHDHTVPYQVAAAAAGGDFTSLQAGGLLTTTTAGSGAAHSHTLSSFNIKYADCIIAVKG